MSQRHPDAGESAALNSPESASDYAAIESLEEEWKATDAAFTQRKRQEASVSVLRPRHLTYGQQTRTISIIKEHVRPGHRHPLALGLSGVLAQTGVSKEQTRELFFDLFDDDPEIDDRLRCVDDTYERLHSGLSVAGYSTLEDHLPRYAVLELQQVLPPPFSFRVIHRESIS